LKTRYHYIIFLLLLAFLFNTAEAQLPRGIPRLPGGGGGRGGGGGQGSDTLKRRDQMEDSITITYHYLDSTHNSVFDSTLSDFTVRYPIPPTYVYLGNTGNAARSILFAPSLKAGWDPGFHAFDIYKWKLENVRFFNTTRPYSELGYVLGSNSHQIIELIHTQNIRPYWNINLQHRLISSPGFFKNQNTNHNNYLVSSWYQSPKKRYNNYVAVVSNKLQSAENGGIADERYLDDPLFNKRFTIPIKMGGDPDIGTDFFSNALNTGNRYKEFNFLMRQQYDLGRKDSLVTDSTVIPLFYPRLRFEHTLKTGKYKYSFLDLNDPSKRNTPDSLFYDSLYNNYVVPDSDSIHIQDSWRELSNDFSIYQFPDAKNLHQCVKLGIEYQLWKGEFDSGRVKESCDNFIAHGEYRNRSRNQKWDIEAFGRLWLNGFNAGDYHAYISLQRLLSKSIGSLQVGFENVNRSPSYLFDNHSSFYLDDPAKSFSKENTLHFFAVSRIPKLRLQLGADYFLISNYLYFSSYYQLAQEAALFNFLRINASKTFKINRRWNLYSDIWVQQKTGSVDLNTPLVYTRHRLAFEGNFFKNLNLSTGLEVRYHTPYKADNYSPVIGQFFYQDTATINNLPEVSAFLHFRIRSFKGYLRAENLNTLRYNKELGFTRNNLAAPNYPYPGLMIRFGIYWSFVN
jgi:hypothetical protein